MRGFIDESSAVRSGTRQEYLVGAAVVPPGDCEDIRAELKPLLLPGQIKVHWTDESEKRRQTIVDAIIGLGAMNFVVTHVSERSNKTERFRRKCMERLYFELGAADVWDLTLESRTPPQDKGDRRHIVALQGQGYDRRIRISHARGGDEPLLWIPDALLGALNSARGDDPQYWDRLSETVVVEAATVESLPLTP